MKKPTGKPVLQNPYTCRKCLRDDFKKSMEFTKHLRKCNGPIMPGNGAPGRALPVLCNEGVVAILTDLSRKAGAFKEAVDLAIKRLK